MLDDAIPFVYVKDFSENGKSKFFLKDSLGFREVETSDLRSMKSNLICHDFWLIKDELAKKGGLPTNLIDLDEVHAAVSHFREISKLRDRENILCHVPHDYLKPEIRKKYESVFYRRDSIDAGVLEQICDSLYKYAKFLFDFARANDELERLTQVELPIFNILNRHSAYGVCVDTNIIRQFRETIQYEYFNSLKVFSNKFNVQPEVMSDAQVEDYLWNKGFFDDEVSVEYMLEYIPFDEDFGPSLQYLRKLKAAHGILNELSLSKDVVYPIVDCFGTRTSRIVYRSPLLQNIPKQYRGFLVPRTGKRFCYIDYDQFEIGIMAALSGDVCLKELYGAGDMYEVFANDHLGVQNFRKKAKSLFLSYAYGMSKEAVVEAAKSMGIDRPKAKAAFKNFAAFEGWKKDREREYAEKGRIATLLGNYIVCDKSLPSRKKEFRSMISQCIQGTGSLIFKKALQKIANLDDVIITLPMHDAVLFEYSDPNSPEQVRNFMIETMGEVLGYKVQGKASEENFFLPIND